MKKTLLSIAALVISSVAVQAQVIINSSNINPSIGQTYYQTVDTTIDQTIVITSPGANQTWDFHMLNNQDVDTLSYINASSAPKASNFPTATNCLSTTAKGKTSYDFMLKNSTKIDGVGRVMVSPFNPDSTLIVKLKPAQRMANFPSKQGDAANVSYYKFKIQVKGSDVGQPTIDSVRITQSGKRIITPDADGALTTPDWTKNALRIETISMDSTKIEGKMGVWVNYQNRYDTTYTYDFWVPEISYPVLTLTYNYTIAEVTKAQWLTGSTLGLKSYASTGNVLKVFPNPSNGKFNVLFPTSGTLQLIDALGKVIYSSNYNKGNNLLDFTAYSEGIYQMLFVGETGTSITQKIVINK